MNFLTPKFKKTRCFVPLFEASDSHFYIKWAIHGLIFIFKFVRMHEYVFFIGRWFWSRNLKLKNIHFFIKNIKDFNVESKSY
jgi:hypothetical protein